MEFREFIDQQDQELAQWLQGSTVTNIVYHGTSKSPFKIFNYQPSKRYVLFSEFDVTTHGFFFSESPHEALEFGPNVVACYIKLMNPFLDPRRDKYLSVDRLPEKKELELMKIMAPMIEKENGEFFFDLGVSRYYLKDRNMAYARQWIYNAVGSDGIHWDILDNPQVVKKMQQLGYDGSFTHEESNSELGRSIFVINPEQIRIINWYNRNNYPKNWGKKDDYSIYRSGGFGTLQMPDPNKIYDDDDDYED